MRIRNHNDVMIPLAPKTLEEWENKRRELIERIKFSTSLDLMKNDAPLSPISFGTVEYESFVIENVIFQSLPGFFVAGNIYRPKDISSGKKYPAVLNPHGHWTNGRLELVEHGALPKRYANFAMRGIVAFAYDMIGYNDTIQVPHRYHEPDFELWNVGRFPLQLYNSVKAVDFVSSLEYVDSERIGCTGASGGGTQTYFLTAVDERIKVSAPICMTSALMQGGCICENTAFLRTEYCNVDYTAVTAPRPLFLSAVDGDWTRNSREVEFPAIANIYKLYGAEDNFENFYHSAQHCYDKPTRERVYKFFCRHFGIDDPFDGEIDIKIDVEKLKIGTIPECEGFIHNDAELFELEKELITKNLKDDCSSEVFAFDHDFYFDIPYVITDNTKIILGECPSGYDCCSVKYYHTYNYADDTKRVNCIVKLCSQYKGYTISAKGKTAALCELAKPYVSDASFELTDVDNSNVFVPGIKLLKKI